MGNGNARNRGTGCNRKPKLPVSDEYHLTGHVTTGIDPDA